MNQAHFHLILSHLPLIGTVLGIAVLVAGFIFKSAVVKRTALALFIFSAVAAIAVYLTGEGAEEVVEHLPGVSEPITEEHEDFATIYLWAIGGLGVLSAITLLLDFLKPATSNLLYMATLVLAIGVAVAGWRLGGLGGEIRHTEIRSDQSAQPNGSEPANEKGNNEDDD